MRERRRLRGTSPWEQSRSVFSELLMSQLRSSGRVPTADQISRSYWFSAAKSQDLRFVRKHLDTFQGSADENGDSALILAVRNNDLEMVKLLGFRERGIRNHSGFSALMVAAARGLDEICRRLAPYEQDLTVSLDLPDPLDQENDGRRVDGLTPLMLAARAGKVEAVRALCPFFSGRRDSRGWTALCHAMAMDNPECVQVLGAVDDEAAPSLEFVQRFSAIAAPLQKTDAFLSPGECASLRAPGSAGAGFPTPAAFTPSPADGRRWASIRGDTVSPNAGPSGPGSQSPARQLLRAVADGQMAGAEGLWGNRVAASPNRDGWVSLSGSGAGLSQPAGIEPRMSQPYDSLQGLPGDQSQVQTHAVMQNQPEEHPPALSRFDSAPVVELERAYPVQLPPSSLGGVSAAATYAGVSPDKEVAGQFEFDESPITGTSRTEDEGSTDGEGAAEDADRAEDANEAAEVARVAESTASGELGRLQSELSAARELLGQRDLEILSLKGTISKLQGELKVAREALFRRLAAEKKEKDGAGDRLGNKPGELEEMEDIDSIIQRKEQEECGERGGQDSSECSRLSGSSESEGAPANTFDDQSESTKRLSKAVFGPMGEPMAWVTENEVTESEPERFDPAEPSDHSEYGDYVKYAGAGQIGEVAMAMARGRTGAHDGTAIREPEGPAVPGDSAAGSLEKQEPAAGVASCIDAPEPAPESSLGLASADPFRGPEEQPIPQELAAQGGVSSQTARNDQTEPAFKLRPPPVNHPQDEFDSIACADYSVILQSENDSLRSQLIILTSEAAQSAEEAREARQKVAELEAELQSLRQEIALIRATTGKQDDRTAATTPVMEPAEPDAFPALLLSTQLSTRLSTAASQGPRDDQGVQPSAGAPREPQAENATQEKPNSPMEELLQSRTRELEQSALRCREAESKCALAQSRAEEAEKAVASLKDENAELHRAVTRLEYSYFNAADRLVEAEMQYTKVAQERDSLLRRLGEA